MRGDVALWLLFLSVPLVAGRIADSERLAANSPVALGEAQLIAAERPISRLAAARPIRAASRDNCSSSENKKATARAARGPASALPNRGFRGCRGPRVTAFRGFRAIRG